MRSEDELRDALKSLELRAPDPESVLSAVSRRVGARRGGGSSPYRRWLRLSAPVLSAAAVIAAVLVPLSLRSSVRAGDSGGPSSSASSGPAAQQALSALAQAAGAQPAPAGSAYRVSAFEGSLGAFGPNAHPFAADLRDELSTTWYPKSSAAKVVSYVNTGEWSMLVTPGARAAWQADGSPSLSSRPSQESLYPEFGTGGFIGDPWFGGETLTVAQYLALPTSTQGLKAAIITAAQRVPKDQQVGNLNQLIGRTCLALLDHDPVSPAVRAAALRVLATLPGIQYHGKVTDPLGRPGLAISMPGLNTSWGTAVPDGVPIGTSTTLEFWLVFSPAGTLLDEESVATTSDVRGTMPASGAIPGPTTCPSGYREYAESGGVNLCVPARDTLSGDSITGPDRRMPIRLGEPIAQFKAGAVLGYRAYIDASWTNDAPSAAHSAQSIPTAAATPGIAPR